MENKKELTIMMTDGIKKSEFSTSNFNPEYQLAIIDGLFKFFDISVDFKEMVATYNKTGQAFQEFYGELEEKALTEVNEPPPIKEEIAETFSGMKINGDVVTYQCHYICPGCKKRANKFVRKFDIYINCQDCKRRMKVQTATVNGDLEQDGFGNYFIAGDYKRTSSSFTPNFNL